MPIVRIGRPCCGEICSLCIPLSAKQCAPFAAANRNLPSLLKNYIPHMLPMPLLTGKHPFAAYSQPLAVLTSTAYGTTFKEGKWGKFQIFGSDKIKTIDYPNEEGRENEEI